MESRLDPFAALCRIIDTTANTLNTQVVWIEMATTFHDAPFL
jgi:hypothetical protein